MEYGVINAVEPDKRIYLIVDEPTNWMRNDIDFGRGYHETLSEMSAVEKSHSVSAFPVLPLNSAERPRENYRCGGRLNTLRVARRVG